MDSLPTLCLTVKEIEREKGTVLITSRIDTFSVTFMNPPGNQNTNTSVNFVSTDIAWPADKKRFAPTTMDASKLAPPPNWIKKYPNGYTAENIFNPQTDEGFQVWMRTSWYPTFRKLYSASRDAPLEAGTYEINVALSKFWVYGSWKRS